jgi:hypothetical protein
VIRLLASVQDLKQVEESEKRRIGAAFVYDVEGPSLAVAKSLLMESPDLPLAQKEAVRVFRAPEESIVVSLRKYEQLRGLPDECGKHTNSLHTNVVERHIVLVAMHEQMLQFLGGTSFPIMAITLVLLLLNGFPSLIIGSFIEPGSFAARYVRGGLGMADLKVAMGAVRLSQELERNGLRPEDYGLAPSAMGLAELRFWMELNSGAAKALKLHLRWMKEVAAIVKQVK